VEAGYDAFDVVGSLAGTPATCWVKALEGGVRATCETRVVLGVVVPVISRSWPSSVVVVVGKSNAVHCDQVLNADDTIDCCPMPPVVGFPAESRLRKAVREIRERGTCLCGATLSAAERKLSRRKRK
jgi:hypothetical protein